MKSPPPLVLALGWLGASERHLSKYTSWHNSQGRDTLSTISPTTSMCISTPHQQTNQSTKREGKI